MIPTMTGKLQPLDEKFPIVGPDGRPTLYFIRWAQQRQIDIGEAITAAQALEIVQNFIDDYEIQAGDGIDIVPDGKLTSNPTISADVQALLDQISVDHGAVLYRDASAWQALAPGTAGYFLKTNGPGADPEWAAGGGGGGGGGMTLIADFTATGSETVASFTGIPSTFKALRLLTFARSSASANDVRLVLQFNGSSSNIYDWRQFFNGSLVLINNDTEARIQQVAGAFVASGIFDMGVLDIFNYASTVGTKGAVWSCTNSEGSNYRDLRGSFRWRNTSAINRIDVRIANGNYVAGSYIALYGY
ncbi:MAG: hypothetical protein C0511_19135 [Hyphomicrobium sp.]|nr:hypothetical protein [Hyphomicrobium sp.]